MYNSYLCNLKKSIAIGQSHLREFWSVDNMLLKCEFVYERKDRGERKDLDGAKYFSYIIFLSLIFIHIYYINYIFCSFYTCR